MKIKNILPLFFLCSFFVSCMFTEEIRMKKDGSGSYTFKIDMGEMMQSFGEMGTKDSLKQPEKIDSTIYFKDILLEHKDSIAALPKGDQEMIKSLEDLKLHIKMDEEKGDMLMDFVFDFKQISELKNMQERISKAQSMSDKKKNGEMMPSNTDVEYSFANGVFKRSVTLKELSQEEKDAYDKSMTQASSMFEETLYRLEYHFDDSIKSVSFKGATISKDRKSLFIELPMDTIMKNPLLLNFEVKLK